MQTIEGFRLSPQQQRLWLLQQQNTAFRAYCSILIEGKLQVTRLQKTLETIAAQNEIYRTTFRYLPDRQLTLQIINESPLFSWLHKDLSGYQSDEQQKKLKIIFHEIVCTPIDLVQGPLFISSLITLSAQKHVLVVHVSPLHADTWTLHHLLHDIADLYAGTRNDQEQTIIQYTQFSEWQNTLLEETESTVAREYWHKKELSLFSNVTAPFEYKNGNDSDFSMDFFTLPVSPALCTSIEALCEKLNCPLPVLLLTCWQLLLWQQTGQNEILIGLGSDGRVHEELESVAGLIAKYVPFSGLLTEHLTFDKLLTRVQETYNELLSQDAYFTWEDVQKPVEGAPVSLLYPFCFDICKQPDIYTVEGISFQLEHSYAYYEPCKLKLSVMQRHADLALQFHYHLGLFARQDVHYLADQFMTLLDSVLQQPETNIHNLTLISAKERELLLSRFNQTSTSSPENDVYLHTLFEEHAVRLADAIAVCDENGQITYSALNDWSNRVAYYLQSLKVGPEVPVGLYLERSIELVIGILGILKAGGCYVPLDPTYPEEHLAFIVSDARIKLLLTIHGSLNYPSMIDQIVCLDTDWSIIAQQCKDTLSLTPLSSHLAYIIYTSGSTGAPKGVMIQHRSAVNYTYFMRALIAWETGWHFALVSTPAADLGNTGLFCSLASGGCLHILSREVVTNGQTFARYMVQHPIDVLKIVPSHLHALLTNMPEKTTLSRKYLVVGGEAFSRGLLQRLQEIDVECEVINHYGPTETTIGVLVNPLGFTRKLNTAKEHATATIPLGHPIANTQVYLLDNQLQLVPIGRAGELYIGGSGLGRGYLNRADLTAERFIPNPFSEETGTRLYKTGDLARYQSADGTLEFLGRSDRQVKLRGFRIELGEIEFALEQHPAIHECVVIMREDTHANRQLIAYIVTNQHYAPDISELRDYLRNKLPAYMVPDDVVIVDAFPLTSNGKINHNLLPLLGKQLQADTTNERRDINAMAPRDMVEYQLLQIWEEILGIQSITITDSFFDLGGHSMLAIRLVSSIRRQFGVDLSLATLFEYKSIADLASVIRQQVPYKQNSILVPIQSGGSKPPFFCVHPVGGTVFCYTYLSRHMGNDQPFYGLQAPNASTIYTSLEDLAARYVAEIQAVQPHGPYYVGGWSSGGVTAFEIAQQLCKQGHEVALLAIIDAFLPGTQEKLLEQLDLSDTAIVHSFMTRESAPMKDDLYLLEPKEQLLWLLEEGKKANLIPSDVGLEEFRHIRHAHLMIAHLQKRYVPCVYSHRIHLFRATGSITHRAPADALPDVNLTQGWEKLASGEIEVIEIPGEHKEMVYEPNVSTLAQAIKKCIDQYIHSS